MWVLWKFSYLFTKSPRQGAQTSIHCAVCDEVQGVSGEFFVDCQVRKKLVNPLVLDQELAGRLWTVSAQLVGLEEKAEH